MACVKRKSPSHLFRQSTRCEGDTHTHTNTLARQRTQIIWNCFDYRRTQASGNVNVNNCYLKLELDGTQHNLNTHVSRMQRSIDGLARCHSRFTTIEKCQRFLVHSPNRRRADDYTNWLRLRTFAWHLYGKPTISRLRRANPFLLPMCGSRSFGARARAQLWRLHVEQRFHSTPNRIDSVFIVRSAA